MPFSIRPYRLFPVRCLVKSMGLRRGMRIALLWCVVAGIAGVAGQADFARAAAPCSLPDATDAIRQSPKDANAYVTRAVCYMTFGPNDQKPPLKNLEAAVKDLEDAIKLDPKNFFARHNYAHVAYLLGYPKFAVSEFTKAISLTPKLREAIWAGDGHTWKRVSSKTRPLIFSEPSTSMRLCGEKWRPGNESLICRPTAPVPQ